MFSPRSITASLLVIALFTAVGCQNAHTPASSDSAANPRSIWLSSSIVNTGNGTTTVYLPTSDGKGVKRLSSSNAAPCTDCDVAAAKYFETGEIAAVCPTCHATRVVVSGHN